uniref:Uncharacterized protein n=1 Tax=Timema douglasi TaxID=61478 RepID=A0A7R8Z837_TIMDO|nr:unnamed protein product [Timema douglasi]
MVHPTEVRTSISPSSAVELITTSVLVNYATEAGKTTRETKEERGGAVNSKCKGERRKMDKSKRGEMLEGQRKMEEFYKTDPTTVWKQFMMILVLISESEDGFLSQNDDFNQQDDFDQHDFNQKNDFDQQHEFNQQNDTHDYDNPPRRGRRYPRSSNRGRSSNRRRNRGRSLRSQRNSRKNYWQENDDSFESSSSDQHQFHSGPLLQNPMPMYQDDMGPMMYPHDGDQGSFQHGGDQGPPMFQQGGDQGPPMFQHGGDQGPPMFQHGGDQGPSMFQHGGDQGPPMFQRGGDQGPPMFQYGGDECPPMFQHEGPCNEGPPMYQHGPPSGDRRSMMYPPHHGDQGPMMYPPHQGEGPMMYPHGPAMQCNQGPMMYPPAPHQGGPGPGMFNQGPNQQAPMFYPGGEQVSQMFHPGNDQGPSIYKPEGNQGLTMFQSSPLHPEDSESDVYESEPPPPGDSEPAAFHSVQPSNDVGVAMPFQPPPLPLDPAPAMPVQVPAPSGMGPILPFQAPPLPSQGVAPLPFQAPQLQSEVRPSIPLPLTPAFEKSRTVGQPLSIPIPAPASGGSKDQATNDSSRYSPSNMEEDIPSPSLPKPPSQSQEPHPVTTPRATVLGKAQAKKRLLAFSLAKQVGAAAAATGAKKTQAKVVPPVKKPPVASPVEEPKQPPPPEEAPPPTPQPQPVIAVVESVELKESKPEKPTALAKKKKGALREDKARSTIAAIEEIKREELIMRGVLSYSSLEKAVGDMTAPIPLPGQPYVPPPLHCSPQDLSNGWCVVPMRAREEHDLPEGLDLEKQQGEMESMVDKIFSEDTKHSSKEKKERSSSRRGRSHSRDRRRRDRSKEKKRSRPTDLPVDWAHFRSRAYTFEEVRRLKAKLGTKERQSREHRRKHGSRDRRSRGYVGCGVICTRHEQTPTPAQNKLIEGFTKPKRTLKDKTRRNGPPNTVVFEILHLPVSPLRRSRDRKHRRSSKDKEKDKSLKADLEQVYKVLSFPSQILHPLLVLGVKEIHKEFSRTIVKFTKARPVVSYCENPSITKVHFKSRKEIFDDSTKVLVDLMRIIIDGKGVKTWTNSEGGTTLRTDANISSSLTALQVSYDEGENEENLSSDEVNVNRKREKAWLPTLKEWLSSKEDDNPGDSVMDSVDVKENDVSINEKTEEPIDEGTKHKERKNSSGEKNYTNSDRNLVSPLIDRKSEPKQRTLSEVSVERTTVRSKWDSDYEEDTVSTENVKAELPTVEVDKPKEIAAAKICDQVEKSTKFNDDVEYDNKKLNEEKIEIDNITVNEVIKHDSKNVNEETKNGSKKLDDEIGTDNRKLNEEIESDNTKSTEEEIEYDDTKLSEEITTFDNLKLNEEIKDDTRKETEEIIYDDRTLNDEIEHDDRKFNEVVESDDMKFNEVVESNDRKFNDDIEHDNGKVENMVLDEESESQTNDSSFVGTCEEDKDEHGPHDSRNAIGVKESDTSAFFDYSIVEPKQSSLPTQDSVVEKSTDPKLVFEYEEFMKAVSFDTSFVELGVDSHKVQHIEPIARKINNREIENVNKKNEISVPEIEDELEDICKPNDKQFSTLSSKLPVRSELSSKSENLVDWEHDTESTEVEISPFVEEREILNNTDINKVSGPNKTSVLGSSYTNLDEPEYARKLVASASSHVGPDKSESVRKEITQEEVQHKSSSSNESSSEDEPQLKERSSIAEHIREEPKATKEKKLLKINAKKKNLNKNKKVSRKISKYKKKKQIKKKNKHKKNS